MIAPSKGDTRSAWLGGEAHVRRQEGGRLWRLPPRWRQVLWLSGALLLGSAIGGGGTAMACRHARSQVPPQKNQPAPQTRTGEPRMNAEQPRRRRETSSVSLLSLAFAVGAAVGAGVALCMAPHSGSEMRRRITSGAKTAQEELSEVIEETRGAVDALTKDARQTLRYTAWRLTKAAAATKAAFQEGADGLERIPGNE